MIFTLKVAAKLGRGQRSPLLSSLFTRLPRLIVQVKAWLVMVIFLSQPYLTAGEITQEINPFESKPLPVFTTKSQGMESFELEGLTISPAMLPVRYLYGWEKGGGYYLHFFSEKEGVPIASFVNGSAVYYDPCAKGVFFINEDCYFTYQLSFKNNIKEINISLGIGLSSDKEKAEISFDPYSVLTAGTLPNTMTKQQDGTWLWTNRLIPEHQERAVDAVYAEINQFPKTIRHYWQHEKTKELIPVMTLESYQINQPINRQRLELLQKTDFSPEVKVWDYDELFTVQQGINGLKLCSIIYYARIALETPELMDEVLFKTVLTGNDMKKVAQSDNLLKPHVKAAFKKCYDIKD